MSLIFDEQALYDNNIFKFENRLNTTINRYLSNGAILTSYYQISENATTVDRGLQDIDQLFGKHSPLRFNKILNFPLYGFMAANPNNIDDIGIDDITVEGECAILPSTIVPNPNDFFMLNHLKMNAIFQITEVIHDTMKVEGYYKIKYRLFSTSEETYQNLQKQTILTYHTDLNSVGTNLNPIIQEDDFIKRKKIHQMVNHLIKTYQSLFYNKRHNCFLYKDITTGQVIHDVCGNKFMGKFNLMNPVDSTSVIVLNDKIIDDQIQYYYLNSIFNWMELKAPITMIERFFYKLIPSDGYLYSSFARWSEDINLIIPVPLNEVGIHDQQYSYFNHNQIDCWMNNHTPSTDYETLMGKYFHDSNLTINDVPLTLSNTLLSLKDNLSIFLYVPIIVYVIRETLKMG